MYLNVGTFRRNARSMCLDVLDGHLSDVSPCPFMLWRIMVTSRLTLLPRRQAQGGKVLVKISTLQSWIIHRCATDSNVYSGRCVVSQ